MNPDRTATTSNMTIGPSRHAGCTRKRRADSARSSWPAVGGQDDNVRRDGRNCSLVAMAFLVVCVVTTVFTPTLHSYASDLPFGSGTTGEVTLPRTPHDPGAAASRRTLQRILDRATDANDGVHDACGGLLRVGDESSVPHLIRVLRFFGDAELPLPPDVGIVCTHAHCVDALEHITGVKVGISYLSWKRWWASTHPGQPLDGPPDKPTKLSAHPVTPLASARVVPVRATAYRHRHTHTN
jgi:hypothetical protein